MDFTGLYRKKIDYIIMSRKLKSTLNNCRSYHSAEIGSDHSIEWLIYYHQCLKSLLIVIANTGDNISTQLKITKKDLQDVTIMIKFKYKMERYQRNLQQ